MNGIAMGFQGAIIHTSQQTIGAEQMFTYQIIDIQTKQPVGKPYPTLRAARRRADKLDLEYGAIRYIVKAVEAAKV